MADTTGKTPSPSKPVSRVVSAADVPATQGSKPMTRAGSRSEVAQALDAVTDGERDQHKLITKVNERLRKVGLTIPGIEVRWNNLVVELEPPRRPVTNAIRRAASFIANAASSFPSHTASDDAPCKPHRPVILDAGSGVLAPGRMTLLLGPPGAGRTTFLRALSGQLVLPSARRSGRSGGGGGGGASEGGAGGGAGGEAGGRQQGGGGSVPVVTAGPLRVHGTVSYNGLPADGSAFEVARTATYIAQTENHLPELTVAETLTFASECQGVGLAKRLYELIAAREASSGVSPSDPDLELLMSLAKGPLATSAAVQSIARMLSIDHVMDTLVGNEILKGISGGQKRRVTIGEMAVGMSQVMMADEITNGLDAASALAIVKALRNLCEHANSTIVATLLQPSPEVVDCFHDVILLSGGRLLYHGPTDQLLSYFGSMGLRPFPQQSMADFAQEVTASPPDQARYRVALQPPPAAGPPGTGPGPRPSPGPAAPLWAGHAWISPKRMRRVFDSSEVGREAAARLATPPSTHELQEMVLRQERYGTSVARMWRTVLQREVTLSLRNMPFFLAGVIQVIFIAFLVSTGFVNLSHTSMDDANLFMSVAFFGLMSLFTTGFNLGPIYCGRLPVFYKQRDHRFLSPASYAVAAVVTRLPDVIVQCIPFSLMVYFSVGFTMSVSRFFLFLLNMFVAGVNSITTFTLIGSVLRNESATQGIGAVVMMVSVLVSGFPIAPSSIPPWWIWFYWVTPMSWGFRSLLITEFTSPAWAPAADGSGRTIGVEALELRGIPTEWKWVWAGIGMVAGISLLQVALQAVALAWLGPLQTARRGPEHENDDDDTHVGSHNDSRKFPTATAANGNGSLKAASTTAHPVAEGMENGWVVAPTPAFLPGGIPSNTISSSIASGPPSPYPTTTRLPQSQTQMQLAARAPSSSPSQLPYGASAPGAAAGPAVAEPFDQAAAEAEAAELGGLGSPAEVERVMAFKPVVMTFRDVSYFVKPNGDKKELQLLNCVSGVFRPGVLTSLMGASGAGKTTLMDVLAGRKTGGRVEGQELVNGARKRMSSFARLMGYVEQLDVHNPYATVEEALLFSAQLRVGRDLLPAAAVRPFVRQMMQVVELVPLAHRIIGAGGVASGGLSTEARKRLTIAVELVANPSIVFMDEPTTGLDARAAGLVMRAVRNTVATGRTVVCTIHQPNRDIMNQFDELLLLKPGGRTIYFGPLGEQQANLVSFFSRLPGVSSYLPHMNPANWMLEVSSPEAEAALGVDFAEVWAASDMARDANLLIDANCRKPPAALVLAGNATNRPGSPDPQSSSPPRTGAYANSGGGSRTRVAAAAADNTGGDIEAGTGRFPTANGNGTAAAADEDSSGGNDGHAAGAEGDGDGGVSPGGSGFLATRYAQPTMTQLSLVLRRALVSQWRNLPYNGMRFTITLVLSWVLGSLYWGRGDNTTSVVGLFDIMGVMFSASIFLGMTNLMMVMPLVLSERSVFYREKASGMYRPVVFAAAQGLAELPFLFVQSVLYVVIMYCTVHFAFESSKALWFWLFMFQGLLFNTYMGMGMMNISPNIPAAIAGCSGCILLWNLFCGFLIYRKDIKPWYLWAYYGNPFTYIIYGCVVTQLGDLDDVFINTGVETVSVAAYIEDTFSYQYSFRGWIVLILFAFIVFFRGASYLGLTRFNFQMR